jgi:aspartyl-tRNA synthetase
MSTTIDPIWNLVAATELQEPGEQLPYRAAAKTFGVDRTTLRRQHTCQTRSNAEEAQERMLLSHNKS